ncbi:MAG: hypothetical protein ABFD64_01375 [Armatimonadota bacterium]
MNKRLSKIIKWVLLSLGVCGVLYGAFVLYAIHMMLQPTNDRDNHDPAKQKEMLRITLDVGDLAPIPKNAAIKTIKTDGNMFTRSFQVIFTADPKTIKEWLHASNGIQKAKIEKSGSVLTYVLKPRLSYNYAEVLVDYAASTVTINVEWS